MGGSTVGSRTDTHWNAPRHLEVPIERKNAAKTA
jgi:hypothetical protein